MPTNVSSSASKCINGYVLEGNEYGVKPDSHGRSIQLSPELVIPTLFWSIMNHYVCDPARKVFTHLNFFVLTFSF